MMQRIALIILSSVLLTGCNLLNNSFTSSAPTTTPTIESEKINTVVTASQQISDAFTSGKPLQCQVTSSTAGEPPSTYFIKGKKMRMESQPSMDEGIQFFSINDETNIYIWASDPTTPAVKMSLDQVKQSANNFDNDFQNFPDLTNADERQKIAEAGYTITCLETEISDQQFIPPTDIPFKDFAEIIGNTVE
jgi:hypothetical protein